LGNPDDEDVLLKLLVESLSGTSQIKGYICSRDKLVKKIADFLQQNKFERLKIQDLVQFSGVNERTLQYAFKATYGISPMDFIKRTRLHAVCRELRMHKYSSIADIANRYHFWHMGQFAADFKKIYGLLPAEYRNRW
jgi:AraC family ethanolamine operon transcriptional activator